MKKLKVEKILCFFIILLPILDILSFWFRNYFGTTKSPSTIIRPIIPVLIMIYIFLKNKFKLKTILIGLIYAIYAGLHLYIFYNIKTISSYGSITHELQYLINYSFGILNLFIFLFVFYKKNTDKIYISILIANAIYILSLYIAIITKTSSSTYLEGIGYKGWFESGNSISAILILNLFIIFSLIYKFNNLKLRVFAILEIILSGIFLIFLVGTRTGLLGFVLSICVFLFAKIFIIIIRNIFINKKGNSKVNKLILILSLCCILLILLLVVFKGSSLLKRRKYLKSIENNIYDSSTGATSHITGNVLKFKEQIEKNEISTEYMSEATQKSILSLYKYANEHNFSNTDRRSQQLIFNTFLVLNQKNIASILFGNGFLANFGELILEMEIPALLFNFGIIGFILYFIPYLALFVYYGYFAIKNIKKIDEEFLVLFAGSGISFVLSFLLGQLFFNSSAIIIIVIINVLLYNKLIKLNMR